MASVMSTGGLQRRFWCTAGLVESVTGVTGAADATGRAAADVLDRDVFGAIAGTLAAGIFTLFTTFFRMAGFLAIGETFAGEGFLGRAFFLVGMGS